MSLHPLYTQIFVTLVCLFEYSVLIKYCGPPQQYLSGVMESVLSLGSLKECLALLRHTYNVSTKNICIYQKIFLTRTYPLLELRIWLIETCHQCREALLLAPHHLSVNISCFICLQSRLECLCKAVTQHLPSCTFIRPKVLLCLCGLQNMLHIHFCLSACMSDALLMRSLSRHITRFSPVL